MKRFAQLLPLSLVLALAAFAAQAQTPAAEPAVSPAEPEVIEVRGPADEAVAAADETTRAAPRDAHCLRETGTRIKRRDKNGCISAFGRAYTRDELERTGHNDLGSALSTLDPAVGGR